MNGLLSHLKILVVEDDPGLREVLVEEFEFAGAEVTAAASGSEAFEVVKNRNFDLIFSDVQMPNGGGVELVEKVRTHCAWQPVVVFCSGYNSLSDEFLGKWGVAKVFDKPYERLELLHWIKENVRHSR